MMNRNKSQLERINRYRDPDDGPPDEGDAPQRVPWFGLRLKTATIFRVGFGMVGLMLALICARFTVADRIPGLPHDTLWFNIVFVAVVMLLSFTSFSMFRAATNVFRQEIREIDARMARRDDATEEEVEEYVRQSDKQLNRRMFWRNVYFMAALVILYPTLGSTLIFPWGNIVYFILGMLVALGSAIVWWYYREPLANTLRGLLGRPQQPRDW